MMKKFDTLEEFIDILKKDQKITKELAIEERGFSKLILDNKDKTLKQILGGYKSVDIKFEDEHEYTEYIFEDGKAKVTIMDYEKVGNEYLFKYYIRKLSDNGNTLGHYTYEEKKGSISLIKYDICSREKKGISLYNGLIASNDTSDIHLKGKTEIYSYEDLEAYEALFDMKELSISVIMNVMFSLKNSKKNIKPVYDESVETLNGEIVNLETNVRSNEDKLFKKGSTSYSLSEEKTLKL